MQMLGFSESKTRGMDGGGRGAGGGGADEVTSKPTHMKKHSPLHREADVI